MSCFICPPGIQITWQPRISEIKLKISLQIPLILQLWSYQLCTESLGGSFHLCIGFGNWKLEWFATDILYSTMVLSTFWHSLIGLVSLPSKTAWFLALQMTLQIIAPNNKNSPLLIPSILALEGGLRKTPIRWEGEFKFRFSNLNPHWELNQTTLVKR